jgi:L-fuconolactonase
MRIDAQQHYRDLSLLDSPWIPRGPSLLRPTYLPDTPEPALATHRFEGSAAVQANVVMEETWWLLDLAPRHESIRGLVAWADLTDSPLGRTPDICPLHPSFRRVRHVRWMLRADALYGLKEPARRDIPCDLLVRPPSPAFDSGTGGARAGVAHGNRSHFEAAHSGPRDSRA